MTLSEPECPYCNTVMVVVTLSDRGEKGGEILECRKCGYQEHFEDEFWEVEETWTEKPDWKG